MVAEQQRRHATLLTKHQAREAEQTEGLRAKERAFEASCYEHRQRMLAELEQLKHRQRTHILEAEARERELGAQAAGLAQQQQLDGQSRQNAQRARELEAAHEEDELVRRQREIGQEHARKLLELERMRGTQVDELGRAEAARQRAEKELARAGMKGEKLAEAQAALLSREEELASLREQVRTLAPRVAGAAEERGHLEATLRETELTLQAANSRGAALLQQRAEHEEASNARLAESSRLLQKSAAALQERSSPSPVHCPHPTSPPQARLPSAPPESASQPSPSSTRPPRTLHPSSCRSARPSWRASARLTRWLCARRASRPSRRCCSSSR